MANDRPTPPPPATPPTAAGRGPRGQARVKTQTPSPIRWVLTGLVPLGLAAAVGVTLAFQVLSAPPAHQQARLIVRNGTTLNQIARELAAKGVLRHAKAAELYGRFRGWDKAIRPGFFLFREPKSAPQVLFKIASGQQDAPVVTIPEGYSTKDASKLLKDLDLSPEKYLEAVQKPSPALKKRFSFLPEGLLEGYLFPDTYQLAPDGEQLLVENQITRFAAVALPLWEKRDPDMPLTFAQAINLASIVEKEAVKPEERAIIAGVFHKRLKIGMPLGSDPTVEYALGWHQTEKGLTWDDVKIDSPYNTYKYAGLPPTPICNPGKAAIEAVMNPADTEYLFFVANGDGSHSFGRNVAEHNAHIQRILKNRR